MKRCLLLLLCFVVVLSVVGCKGFNPAPDHGNPEVSEQTDPSGLAGLEAKIAKANQLIGIAYLGWFENDAEWAKEELLKQDYVKELSFVKDIVKYAEYDGYRMYAIVPADTTVTLSVHKCEFDDNYHPRGGDTLISANQPILIRGNMSDTIPNLYIIAQKGSQKVEYALAHSGMDGKLVNDKNVFYDFTPYSLMPEFASDNQVGSETDLVATAPEFLDGNWKMVSGETDGYQFSAEEEGIDSELTMVVGNDAVTAKYYFSTEFITERFEAEAEYMEEPLYHDCGNEVWKVKLHLNSGDFDDGDEFNATLLDKDTLLLQHIFPFDGTLGVSYSTFVRK